MAKKRRIKSNAKSGPPANDSSTADSARRSAGDSSSAEAARSGTPFSSGSLSATSLLSTSLSPMNIALAILAGALIYVSYYPSDSIAVESGDALWFGMIAVLVGTIAMADSLWRRSQSSDSVDDPKAAKRLKLGGWLDVLVCALPIWITIAAWLTSPPGNLRLATNEAWLWISGAAVFVASRRIFADLSARRTIVLLVALCAIGLAVHGLHQEWIGLPQLQAEYEADPDGVLAKSGIVAPEGSSERMVFANRLYDGGASGTFALANSLAGSLLVGCLIVVAVLRFQWRQMQSFEKAAWFAALLICVVCLSYTRSRSATASLILGTLAMLFGPALFGPALLRPASTGGAGDQPVKRSKMRVVLVAMAAGLVAMAGAGTMIAAFGKSEWFEQAIPSLAFRFQYWRSTLQLALDRPLFGCGPGNFQAIYQQYRELSANEQIADPHNFLFETLASGGFIALAILIAALAMGAWLGYQNGFAETPASLNDESDQDFEQDASVSKWSWLGAGAALFLIWMFGFVSGQFPDFQAQSIAVPIALGLSLLLWPAVGRLHRRSIDLMLVVCVGALLLHLLAAGGWTIPGLAILIWLFAGAFARIPDIALQPKSSGRPVALLAATIVTGVVLIFCLRSLSLQPVQQAAKEMGEFQSMLTQQSGRVSLRSMKASLDRVIQADPWSPDAYLSKADLVRLQIVGGETDQPNSALRKQWQQSLQQAIERAGQSPALNRAAAGQVLHVYQRWGDAGDLGQAKELLDNAAKWSPADHWISAQLAVVLEKRGESDRALQLAKKARMLADLGNNAERSLDLQMVYAAESIGIGASNGPRIVAASKALANQLDISSVNDQN